MKNTPDIALPFRQAMSQLSAAVTVLTTDGPGGRCGMTATAVASVTDTPPTIMVCLNRSSAMNRIFKENGRLCVNILAHHQEEIARHFAGMTGISMEDRFALDVWSDDLQPIPRLRDAAVCLAGRVSDAKEVGTHTVLFVEVDDITLREDRGSLVYFNRVFHPLQVEVHS